MPLTIITEPTLYLVGRQTKDAAELDRFLSAHNVEWASDTDVPAEALVETAGRLCYMSFARPRPGGNAAYLDHILDVGHGSVLEHAVWNFIVTGVSRSLSHELVRHRAGWAFSQLSQRYVDQADVAFVVPPALIPAYCEVKRIEAEEREFYAWLDTPEGEAALAQSTISTEPVPPIPLHHAAYYDWLDLCERASETYSAIASALEQDTPTHLSPTDRRKWARQAARSVLPECTETKLFLTANARALRHFIELRATPHADAEIRRLAVVLLRRMQTESPHLFGDYRLSQMADGSWVAETDYRKV